MRAKAAEMACHEHQIATVDIQLPAHGREDRAEGAREEARQAIRKADRAEAEAWSIRMEGYGGPRSPRRPSRNASMAVTAGCRCNAALRNRGQHSARTRPPAARYADLETRGGAEMPVVRTPRYSPPVHMIRLTEERQTAPYIWVHPDDDDR